MCQLMREMGSDPAPALKAAALTETMLNDPSARLASGAELAFIRQYREQLAHVDQLAVVTGKRYHLAVFGALGVAMLTARTLWDSIQVAMRYQDLNFSWCRFDAQINGHELMIAVDASQVPSDLRDFLVCRDMAAIDTVFKDLRSERMPYVAVGLNLHDDKQAQGLDDCLMCQADVKAGSNFMRFPVSMLTQTNSHHSMTTHAMSLAACDAQLSLNLPTSGAMSAQIEALIMRGNSGHFSFDDVAEHMGFSIRHLRRLLAQEGTSYGAIREQVLRTRAEHLLTSTRMSLAQIAEQLGFADASSFSQTFRRWRGVAPSQYRQQWVRASPAIKPPSS